VVSFELEMNGASTAGWSVTVSGLGFGGLDATPTSTIGLSHCLTAAWASSTSAVCMLAPGDGVLQVGTATVSGIAGTRTATFSYDGPWLLFCAGSVSHGIFSGQRSAHRAASSLWVVVGVACEGQIPCCSCGRPLPCG
jgi:hypothetical protein